MNRTFLVLSVYIALFLSIAARMMRVYIATMRDNHIPAILINYNHPSKAEARMLDTVFVFLYIMFFI